MENRMTSESTARAAQFRFLTFGVGLVWYAFLELALRQPRVGLIAATVTALVLSFWFFRWKTTSLSRWTLPSAAIVIFGTSLVALSFVPKGLAQHGVSVLGGLLLTGVLQQSMETMSEGIHGRVAMLIMTICFWFGYIGLLSAGIFSSIDWWQLGLAGAVLSMLVALVVWLEAGAPWKIFRRALPLIGIFGAELMIAIWWLPTSVLVGSIVATTVMMLFLQLCRHIWLNTWQAVRGRRYATVGSLIIILTLLTARWI